MSDGFTRHPTNGAPYVDHPTRLTEKGRPARVMYGRPSNFGSQIENRYGIEKWSERHVLLGASLIDLAGVETLDPEDEVDRTQLDGLAAEAKKAAGAHVAARRGTLFHELTQYLDQSEESPLTLLATGEELGLSSRLIDAVIGSYDTCMQRHGLKVLGVEQTVVDDRWRLAGTLDRIVELTRDLTFENLMIPAGTRLVLDIKTGRLKVEGGRPSHWHSYAVQIASYSHSVPYWIEGLEERRLEWPWPISQRHGLIMHLDIRNAIEEGVATAALYHVDLVVGHMAGNLCRQARDWQNRRDVIRAHDEPPVARTVRDPF